MASFFGFNAPFIGGNEGVLSRQEDDRLIRNDLLQLLLTASGERVMRPDFGGGIRDFMFENLDESGLDSLRSSIENAIEIYEKRVTITDVQLIPNEDNNLLNVKIYGFFNFDRFNVDGLGALADSELLVELNLNTRKINPVV